MSTLMAVKINGRLAKAPRVQEVFTKYGCNIRTRIGFHETDEDQCSGDGNIILQLSGQEDGIQGLLSELNKMDGVAAKIIEF